MKKVLKLIAACVSALFLCAAFVSCDDSNSHLPADYTVKIVDGLGNPVSNIIVRFIDADGNKKTKITGTDGIAKLEGSEVSSYTVKLEKGQSNAHIVNSEYEIKCDNPNLQIVLHGEIDTSIKTEIYGSVPDNSTAYIVSLGSYVVPEADGAMTYMQFMSGSDGVFEVSIESDNNATTVGNYGIPHFVQPEHIWVDGEDYDGKKFTVQITDGTTPYILGVKRAADESCIIKIRRVSDLPYDPSRLPWTEVTAKMQLTQFTLPEGTNLVDLDIANPNLTLTLGQDGYYYYNGKQVLIRLNTASSVLDPIALIAGIINENVGINFGGFIYDGETIVGRNRYNSMIGSYSAICDPTEGVCPLTEELAEAIKVHGEQAGWWNPEAMNYLFADKPAAKASAWLFACCVAE